MFISTISTQNISYINHSTGVLYNTAAMPALRSNTLTWERIRTTGVGLDFGFFNNEINGSFDWFGYDTKGMLCPRSDSSQYTRYISSKRIPANFAHVAELNLPGIILSVTSMYTPHSI